MEHPPTVDGIQQGKKKGEFSIASLVYRSVGYMIYAPRNQQLKSLYTEAFLASKREMIIEPNYGFSWLAVGFREGILHLKGGCNT